MQRTAERLRRATRHNPCPICGRPDWCGIASDFAVCMRVESAIITANGGWVHRLGAARPALQIVPTDPPRATRQVCDRVYRALLDLLPLWPIHYQALQERGFTSRAIGARQYRTLPPETQKGTLSRAALAYSVSKALDIEFDGIPGFAMQEGPRGPRWYVAGAEGLVIPVRDADGLIVGCQIRTNEVGWGRKYRWLSGRDLERGTPAAAYLHVARPVKTTTNQVWITEGPLKADRSAESLGAVVLAMPGVSTWREVPGAVQALGARQIVLAYDADLLTNPQVRLHAQQLTEALHKLQIPVSKQDALAPPVLSWARWDGAKGIDDALQAGLTIMITPLQ